MSEFWVSNSVGNVSEDGSQISPFRSLASLHSAVGGDLTGHTIRLKAGDVFDEDVDTVDRSFRGNLWTIEDWQPSLADSIRPIVTRAKRNLTWTYDPTLNVWISNQLSSIGHGGCILEDGVAMPWVSWGGTRELTASAMQDVGCASFDLISRQYIIRPSRGIPSDHVYAASAGIYLFRLVSAGNFTLRNVKFELSSAGMMWGYPGSQTLTGGWTVEDIEIANCGAYSPSSAASYSGNGFGIVGNTNLNGRSVFRRSIIRDIWDSGYSPQVFSESGIVESIDAYELDISRCGLAGAEISVTSASNITSSIVRDCSLKKSKIRDCGYGWSGRRFSNGDGIVVLTNNSNVGCFLSDIDIDQNDVRDCINAGIYFYQTNSSGTIARRNFVSGCKLGIGATSRAGFQSSNDVAMIENVIDRCETGSSAGRASSGLAGSVVRIDNNVIRTCDVGFSDITRTGDAAFFRNNVIMNSLTAISRSGVGSLVRSKNALFSNDTNFVGVQQDSDIVMTEAPEIGNDGSSYADKVLHSSGTTTSLCGDKMKAPDQMYIGKRPKTVRGHGYREI